MRRVCVFSGAARGRGDVFLAAAAELGRELGARGLGLVYGGASVGTMGALADATLAAGAEVIGVIPALLVEREIAHAGLTRLETVSSMHERKARMVELCDAFVALPGGFGTLDELFEVTTWAQLGLHHKPIGLLDLNGWFSPLVDYVDRAVEAQMIRAEHRRLWVVSQSAGELLDRLAAHRVPDVVRVLSSSDES